MIEEPSNGKRFAYAAIRGEIDVLVQYGLKFIPY